MSFKVIFFLIVGYGKYSSFVRLKREYYLHFVPVPDLKVKIDKKTHLIKDVIYDLDRDTFNVALEEDAVYEFGTDKFSISLGEDDISRYNRRILKVDKLVEVYIKNGWEEFIPTDYKNIITSPEMHEIIEATNDIKEELKPDAFIEMVSAMMVESKLTRSLELVELFYFCNMETCQSVRIMERIKALQKLRRENNGRKKRYS